MATEYVILEDVRDKLATISFDFEAPFVSHSESFEVITEEELDDLDTFTEEDIAEELGYVKTLTCSECDYAEAKEYKATRDEIEKLFNDKPTYHSISIETILSMVGRVFEKKEYFCKQYGCLKSADGFCDKAKERNATLDL